MADVQPDSTDKGTLRPKRKPLQKAGDNFIPMDVPEFTSRVMLPSGVTPLDALSIFSLFFPDQILDTIVESTNQSAIQIPGPNQLHSRAYIWVPLTCRELKTYLAVIIYMGLYEERQIEDYWSIDDFTPFHIVCKYIALHRFQAIYRRIKMQSSEGYEKDPLIWSKVRTLSRGFWAKLIDLWL